MRDTSGTETRGRQRRREGLRRERLVAALGAAVGAALLCLSALDFGDPREAARARAARDARARAETLRSTWELGLAREEPPIGAYGPVLGGRRIGSSGLESSAPGGSERGAARPSSGRTSPDRPADDRAAPAPTSSLFDALLETARAAAARDELPRAVAFAHDALRSAPDDPRRPEAELELARAWSRMGEVATARPYRERAAAAPVELTADGYPVALLAALLEPVDGALAVGALERGAAAALWDGAPTLARTEAGLALEWSPRARAVRAALSPVVEAEVLDAALGVPERINAAIAAFVRRRGVEPRTDRWTIVDGTLALRRTATGVRAVALAASEAVQHLAGAAADAPSPGPVVHGPSDHDPDGVVLAEVSLEGLDGPFRISHTDPEASALPELRRLRILRGGLVLLGLLTAGAAIVAARSMAQARRLAELRSTFVASVSHDLRTPAQAILLLGEALEEGRVVGEASRAKYHTRIRREAERMRRLVEDLLDGARVDRGEGPRIEVRRVETEPWIDALERDATERAARDGAEARVVRESLPVKLEFDPEGVRRAVWNLFENALRYGHGADETARVTLHFACDGDALVVTVSDEGPGIPARLRETVFEPFERVRANGDGIAGDTGTGLGLSIVRGIARAHGGDARLDAPPDGGTGARFVARFGPRDIDGGGAA